ncbi:MAG TPA: hypothetical protein VGF83_03335, partial [Actinomycetota bacterium]
MNDRPLFRRLLFLALGTLVPAAAAGLVAGRYAGVRVGLLAGAAACLAAFVLALLWASEAARHLRRVQEGAEAQARGLSEERDEGFLEVQTLGAAIEGMD